MRGSAPSVALNCAQQLSCLLRARSFRVCAHSFCALTRARCAYCSNFFPEVSSFTQFWYSAGLENYVQNFVLIFSVFLAKGLVTERQFVFQKVLHFSRSLTDIFRRKKTVNSAPLWPCDTEAKFVIPKNLKQFKGFYYMVNEWLCLKEYHKCLIGRTILWHLYICRNRIAKNTCMNSMIDLKGSDKISKNKCGCLFVCAFKDKRYKKESTMIFFLIARLHWRGSRNSIFVVLILGYLFWISWKVWKFRINGINMNEIWLNMTEYMKLSVVCQTKFHQNYGIQPN